MLSREQLDLIYGSINDLIFLVSVEAGNQYVCVSVNSSYLEISGLPIEHFENRPIEDIFPPEEQAYLKTQYGQAMQSGAPMRYETRVILGGETVYLETTLVPVRGEDSGRYLVGVSRDITERKQEKRALELEKARAESYLDIAEAIILALDTSGRILMLNNKGHDLLGYPRQSLIGERWADVALEPAQRQKFAELITSYIRDGGDERAISSVYDKQGNRHLISWKRLGLTDNHGKLVGVLSSGEDITDRRRAEKAMIASQRVVAAGEIASAVAHDYNNSLQGIVGNIEIVLANSDLDEEVTQRLQAASKLAMDAAERTRILQQISGYHAETNHETYDLNELVEDVISQTRHLWNDEAARHGVTIDVETQLSPAILASEGNVGELRSVLYNVVKNAIEAMPSGGLIRFTTLPGDAANLLRIVDTGEGMDTVTSTRLFEPFYSTKGYESGRGLGMSASHSIVSQHLGEIAVLDSAPGRGTTIEIRLPLLSPSSTREQTYLANIQEGRRLLWVDDDPSIRELAAQYFDTLGYIGDIAGSGEEALEMIEQTPYAIIMTDIGMPGMNGFELARRIGERTDGGIPVIALTGWGQTLSRQDQSANGISRVLSKPIRLEKLREILDQLI